MRDYVVEAVLPAPQWSDALQAHLLSDMAFLQPVVAASEQYVVLRLQVRSREPQTAERFVRQRLTRYAKSPRWAGLRIISCSVVNSDET